MKLTLAYMAFIIIATLHVIVFYRRFELNQLANKLRIMLVGLLVAFALSVINTMFSYMLQSSLMCTCEDVDLYLQISVLVSYFIGACLMLFLNLMLFKRLNINSQ